VKRLASLVAGAALAALTSSGGQAQSIGPSVSVSIVDAPRVQSKWGYSPAARQVPPGTWVTWSNDGEEAHTVTAEDGSFDSGNLDPSEGFSWFFDQPDTEYEYTCTLHPWMTGAIVVTGDD
jgi:plastocyanin